MGRHGRCPAFESQTPVVRKDAATLPLLGREPAEQRDHFAASTAKCAERQKGIVALILSLFGPAVWVRWTGDLIIDSPFPRIARLYSGNKYSALVRDEHELEARDDQFFDVPEVTHNLFCRPFFGSRTVG